MVGRWFLHSKPNLYDVILYCVAVLYISRMNNQKKICECVEYWIGCFFLLICCCWCCVVGSILHHVYFMGLERNPLCIWYICVCVYLYNGIPCQLSILYFHCFPSMKFSHLKYMCLLWSLLDFVSFLLFFYFFIFLFLFIFWFLVEK